MGEIKKQVLTWLLSEREEKYQKFSSSLLPNVNNVLGIRIPKLRKYAKTLVKQDYESFLYYACQYMEETMLQGMLIGLIKESADEKLCRIRKYLPKVDNWSLCDCFCCGLKFTKTNLELVWKFITPLIHSANEYEVRFALVMMLNYFINVDYIDRVLIEILKVKHEGYYAKMGAAWALSICYIKFPEKTYVCLEKLPDIEIKIKAVRKICESYQVSKEEKIRLKEKLF